MSSDDDKENEEIGSGGNDWGSFMKVVFIGFIHILLLGLLGANFVYLTRVDLDLFFPTEADQRPYRDTNLVGNPLPPLSSKAKKMENIKNASGGCGAPINVFNSKLFGNKYFEGLFDYGIPYSMESREETFGGILTNWFSNKVKYSYIWLRQFIKTILEITGSTCAIAPESMKDIVPFIAGPVGISIIIAITSLWWIPTLVSVFWNENHDWGLIISVIGLFLGWTWFVPIMLSFIQIFGVLFTFTLLPVMLNGKKIMEIMSEKFNSYYLMVLFLLITIGSAFKYLNPIIAIVITIVFLPSFIPPGMNPLMKNNK
jgi:hypothetical protein